MFRMSRLHDGEPQRINSKRFKSKKRNFKSKEKLLPRTTQGPLKLLDPALSSLRRPNHTDLLQLSQVPFVCTQSSEQQGCWQAEVKWCCLLACHLWGGTGWQLTGRMEGESSPVCHISPPNLIPATISLNNNLLPNWKARSNPAPVRRRLSPPKQKVAWHTRGL